MSAVVSASGRVAVGVRVFELASGRASVTVAAKLTFTLAPEVCPLAAQMDPIREEDLPPFKLRADVLVLGRAPRPGEPSRVVVGDVDKVAPLPALGPALRRPPARDDPLAHQEAPLDQQLAPLRGDERLVLENIHPAYPTLLTRLPGLCPRAYVEGPGAARLPLVADTLRIDVGRAIATLTWRGVLDAGHADAEVRVIVEIVEPEPSEMSFGRARQDTLSAIFTLGDALPFGTAAQPARPAPASAPDEPAWIVEPPARALSIGERALNEPPPLRPPLGASPVTRIEARAPSPPIEGPPSRPPGSRLIELLWYDESDHLRIRSVPDWLDQMTVEEDPPLLEEGEEPPPPPVAAEDPVRTDFLRALAQRERGEADRNLLTRLEAVLADPRRPGGHLVSLEGRLRLTFNEAAELALVLGIAAASSLGDPKFDAIVAASRGEAHPPCGPDVTALRARLVEAWPATRSRLQARAAMGFVDRALISRRAYDVREILEGSFLRTFFSLLGERVEIPTYIPRALARRLPIAAAFDARMVAEVVPRADAREGAQLALRVIAVARLLDRRQRPQISRS